MDTNEIVRLYQEERKSLRQIAHIFNTYHRKVKNILLKAGVEINNKNRKRDSMIDMERDKKVVKYYLTNKNLSFIKIGESFNISSNTVIRILNRNNIQYKKRKNLDNYIYDIKEHYMNTNKSVKEVSNDFGLSHTSVLYRLKKEGIDTKTRRKFSIDDNFFEEIDNQYKAYSAGFIFADGYNNTDNGRISISIVAEDSDVLEKINSCCNNENTIKEKEINNGRNQVQTTLSSSQLSNDLENMGCIKNKSLSLTYPSKHIPYKLNKDFLRGYFDGDGSISFNRKANSYLFSLCGTKEFLTEVQKILMGECDLRKTKLTKRGENTYTLNYGGYNQILRIKDFLYKDADIFMNRKFKKWKELVR